jgi:hypothetical protein
MSDISDLPDWCNPALPAFDLPRLMRSRAADIDHQRTHMTIPIGTDSILDLGAKWVERLLAREKQWKFALGTMIKAARMDTSQRPPGISMEEFAQLRAVVDELLP